MSHLCLTQNKREELVEELRVLKTERRKEVAENLEYAKSLGDLSENAEYHEARSAQAALEDRIARMEQLLKVAKIVNTQDECDCAASIRVAVRLRRISDGREFSYTLVGSEEGDVSAGRLSVDAPLGQALAGKKVGDRLTVKAPNGGSEYEIMSIGN